MRPTHLSFALVLLFLGLILSSLAVQATPLRSASEYDYPPFSSASKNGEADGFAVELLREVLAKMGREVSFQTGLWHQIKQDLANDKLDVLPIVARTTEHEALFDFSTPYLSMHGTIVVRKGDSRIRSATDLYDKSVLVMQSDIAEAYIKQYRLSENVVTTETVSDALRLLAEGKHDAVLVQTLIAQSLIKSLRLSNLELVGPPLSRYQELCFAVRKGDKELLDVLNEGLALAVADGTVAALQEKWLAPPLEARLRHAFNITLTVLATLICAALIAYLWQRSLLAQVRIRTAQLQAANTRLAEQEAASRASEERLRAIVQAGPDCIKLLDRQGFLLEMNPAGLAMMGAVSAEQVLGQYVPDLLAPEYRAAYLELHQQVLAGQQRRMEYEVLRLDGRRRWLETHAVPLRDHHGEIVAHLAVTRDISVRKAMEEELALLAHAFDHANWGMGLCKGESHCFDRVNPALAHQHGYEDSAEMQGMSIVEIHALSQRAQLPEILAQVDKQGHYAWESLHLRKDGSAFPVWIEATAVKDAHGKLLYRFATVNDISERRAAEETLRQSRIQLEQERRRFFSILDTLPLYIYLQAPDHHIRYANRCFKQIFGDIQGRKCYEVISNSATPCQPCPTFNAFNSEEPLQWEWQNPAGKTYQVFDYPFVDVDGSRLVIEVGLDISARKQAESALIQAREIAEAANQAKSVFLANMSHELRTPLNAILGFAQLLEQDPGLDEMQRHQAQSIRRGGEYLLTLINDILDLTRIEAGRFELYPVDWDTQTFFDEITHMFRIRADQKGLRFRYQAMMPLPRVLHCDAKRLRQILINLLGNAIKFTEQGSILLRCGFKEGFLRVEVIDSGIGISTDELEKIFEPFQQAGSDRYKRQGSGLGLAITRHLVAAMQGHLSVESKPGQGSLFRLKIPARSVAVKSVSSAESDDLPHVRGYRRSHGEGQLRALVVDDVQDNREVLRHLLEALGFAVAEAENGRVCLRKAAEYKPDVIFMDLRMPEMDGLSATRALRAQQEFAQTPIIVVSASSFAEDKAACFAAGTQAHIAKPVHLPELLDTLAELLSLQWEYAEMQAAPPPDTRDLSPEQAQTFIEFAASGDIMGIQYLAQDLQAEGCCPTVAHRLLHLAQEVDISELRRLAEQYQAALSVEKTHILKS
jgi:PAS domain S-box-containing protein